MSADCTLGTGARGGGGALLQPGRASGLGLLQPARGASAAPNACSVCGTGTRFCSGGWRPRSSDGAPRTAPSAASRAFRARTHTAHAPPLRSLISKSQIRYEGVLVQISIETSAITLSNGAWGGGGQRGRGALRVVSCAGGRWRSHAAPALLSAVRFCTSLTPHPPHTPPRSALLWHGGPPRGRAAGAAL